MFKKPGFVGTTVVDVEVYNTLGHKAWLYHHVLSWTTHLSQCVCRGRDEAGGKARSRHIKECRSHIKGIGVLSIGRRVRLGRGGLLSRSQTNIGGDCLLNEKGLCRPLGYCRSDCRGWDISQ